jgi:DNA-binding transcriptional MocR family regulator
VFFEIDTNRPEPVYRQIIEKIRSLIDEGTLEPGKPLPSSRALAKKLGVNRSTVYLAYAELQALGYLQSRPGSYNIVQRRRKEVAYHPERKSRISWERVFSARAAEIFETFQRFSPERPPLRGPAERPINLAALDLDPRLYPIAALRKCVNSVLAKEGPGVLEYGTYKGYGPLCEYIAQRLRLHGISVSEAEILITNGAQQALDLLIRLFAASGGTVAVESPTYANILPLLRFSGLNIIGIPMRQDGMDLDILASTLSRNKVSFVYTIPNFHNPTGITTSHQHRERLLNICLKQGVPIAEDGFEEDMKYFGKVDLPLKSIDEHDIVIYLGTFSKALFPGLRLGWITAARECIMRLTALKRFADLTSSNLAQIVMDRFCREGYYDAHLRRLHRIFRRRMLVALNTMDASFPKSVTWTRPLGGYTMWVRLPRRLSERELHELLLPHGVVVSPGSYYFPNFRPSEHFRISIARLNEQEIREGLLRLWEALRALA